MMWIKKRKATLGARTTPSYKKDCMPREKALISLCSGSQDSNQVHPHQGHLLGLLKDDDTYNSSAHIADEPLRQAGAGEVGAGVQDTWVRAPQLFASAYPESWDSQCPPTTGCPSLFPPPGPASEVGDPWQWPLVHGGWGGAAAEGGRSAVSLLGKRNSARGWGTRGEAGHTPGAAGCPLRGLARGEGPWAGSPQRGEALIFHSTRQRWVSADRGPGRVVGELGSCAGTVPASRGATCHFPGARGDGRGRLHTKNDWPLRITKPSPLRRHRRPDFAGAAGRHVKKGSCFMEIETLVPALRFECLSPPNHKPRLARERGRGVCP